MTANFEADSSLAHASARISDPALALFLDLLARDIAAHPEHVRAIDAGLLERIHALVGNVEVDLDAAQLPRGDSGRR